ncbi:MAG: ABC transporter ATP-binding protein, partial [Bacteroidetes bacterium]|nr:ABC transporter ATP-binding protein [Bacteroidota bacterium]
MQNDIAIRVKGLSKVYQKKNKNGDQEDFYALKDVNFEVKKGEVVGIIGKNGSGKSTLLKILSGVTKPTTGSVEINGTVASILDVGTGFHADLSGRENVYLRGKLLGMSTKEIDKAFDEIVEFSEIGDFIETPVKNYSSGMFLRLAFSILVFLKCDVLLLDEVLSVGDLGFRGKSNLAINKLVNYKEKTIIFVSHDMNQFNSLDLDFIIFLKNGNARIENN